MLEIPIPGFGSLLLSHLVLDDNGTLAVDGHLVPGVKERLKSLSPRLRLHVLTADTFGMARAALADVPRELSILGPQQQDLAKRDYVERLGAREVICIGNRRNDRFMLESAAQCCHILVRFLGEENAAGRLAEKWLGLHRG